MKNFKKLTRTQRKILGRMGYEDCSNIRYLTERGDSIVFVQIREDCSVFKEILLNKAEYYKML